MTMHYKIVNDEALLTSFVDSLPELKAHERYYLVLLARSKYCKDILHITSDREQLARIVCRKDEIIRRIHQLECPLGNYFQKDRIIPQEALAMYINVNPRDMNKATDFVQYELASQRVKGPSRYDLISRAYSETAKARSRRIYIDFDFDGVDAYELKEQLDGHLNPDAYRILMTRGGAHVLVENEKVRGIYINTWHRKFTSLGGIDEDKRKKKGENEKRDRTTPIPGCTQGNFTPHFI